MSGVDSKHRSPTVVFTNTHKKYWHRRHLHSRVVIDAPRRTVAIRRPDNPVKLLYYEQSHFVWVLFWSAFALCPSLKAIRLGVAWTGLISVRTIMTSLQSMILISKWKPQIVAMKYIQRSVCLRDFLYLSPTIRYITRFLFTRVICSCGRCLNLHSKIILFEYYCRMRRTLYLHGKTKADKKFAFILPLQDIFILQQQDIIYISNCEDFYCVHNK